MEPESERKCLCQLTTPWSLFRRAHEGDESDRQAARKELFVRYGDPAYAYLVRAVRDPVAARELLHEFCVQFLQGDFHKANPEKGRFRRYVKAVLYRLAQEYHRQRQSHPKPLPESSSLLPTREVDDAESHFLEEWRQVLLKRAWIALRDEEKKSGTPYYAVLRLRADHPKLSSEAMAEQLGVQLGKTCAPATVRQWLHRARELFAELVYQEVADSLSDPTHELIVEELCELQLYAYCRTVIDEPQGP